MNRTIAPLLARAAAVIAATVASVGHAETPVDTAAATPAPPPAPPPAAAPAGGLRPYEASYSFAWNGMNAGSSSFTLRHEGGDEWTYVNRNHPHGLFRLVASAGLMLTSRMRIGADGVLPLLFTAAQPDGTGHQAELHFDWPGNRVTGFVEDSAIDMAIKPGVQDDLSVQVALIKALASGQAPSGIAVFDKRGIRDYEYRRVGAETLQTALGAVATIVYRSQRANSPRSTRFWCAPQFGYVPVRAEQERKGEVEWTMNLQSIHFSD